MSLISTLRVSVSERAGRRDWEGEDALSIPLPEQLDSAVGRGLDNVGGEGAVKVCHAGQIGFCDYNANEPSSEIQIKRDRLLVWRGKAALDDEDDWTSGGEVLGLGAVKATDCTVLSEGCDWRMLPRK